MKEEKGKRKIALGGKKVGTIFLSLPRTCTAKELGW